MIIIGNDPELAKLFRNERLQNFFKHYLTELEDGYDLKQFLIKGAEKTYEEQFDQLKNSFIVIENMKKKDDGFKEVERCVDGVRFKVGDMVKDMIDPQQKRLPIGRLYEDDRGLHVRLDIVPPSDKNFTITWRDLSKIEH